LRIYLLYLRRLLCELRREGLHCLLLLGDNRFLFGDCGFQLRDSLLQLRAGAAHHYRLVPKSAVRQANSNKSDAFARSLFGRIHIADIRAVIDAVLAGDSLPDANVATAVDVSAGRTSQGRIVVAADVEKEGVNADGGVVITFCVAVKRTNTGGRVSLAANVRSERPPTFGRV